MEDPAVNPQRLSPLTALVALVSVVALVMSVLALSADGRSLLVHHLDEADQDALRDTIKQRYERRLKEIFE